MKNMENDVRILMLEDSMEDVSLIQREVKKSGIPAVFAVADTREQFEEALRDFLPNIILCDHSMPLFNSIEAIEIVNSFKRKLRREIPLILVTGSVSEEFALQCLQAGAVDFILKDRLKRLPEAIRNALDKTRILNESKSYVDEIIASELRMKEAERLAHFGSWQTDLINGVSKWSDEMYRIFGYEPGGFVPTHSALIDHIIQEELEITRQAIDNTIQSMEPFQSEIRIVTKNGDTKYVSVKINVQGDQMGNPHLLTGSIQDIHERKKAQIELEAQNKRLMEIAWTQSHEVRAPLASLMGLVNLLTRHEQDRLQQKEVLDKVAKSAQDLDDIIKKIVRITEES